LAANFGHVLTFCYLCSKEKIKNVVYSVTASPDISSWQSSIEQNFFCSNPIPLDLQRSALTAFQTDSLNYEEVTIDSSISLKDRHMIHALLKISDNLDQNTLRLSKENEEETKGFSKLETNKKQLILNATKHANEESTPKDPTEFCKSFLLKTTVF
jgi:hypothetical protein